MRKNQGERASENLRHFTNREAEKETFHRLLAARAGEPLPVLMLYGVGGAGKTWLCRKLRQELPDRFPSATINLDPLQDGGRYLNDPAQALWEIRFQLGIECPLFDLAYAMMLAKQGGEIPGSSLTQRENNLKDFAKEGANATLSSVPFANVMVWGGEKVLEWLGEKEKTRAPEYQALKAMTREEIYKELLPRLCEDLDSRLPVNRDYESEYQCRAVVFIDTFEAIGQSSSGGAQQYFREEWVRRLYENSSRILFVLSGQNRLTWPEEDPDWNSPQHLEQYLVGGLSENDARRFLTNCGIDDQALQTAVLEASSNTPEPGFHPWTLGLCVDTLEAEQKEIGHWPAPENFQIARRDQSLLLQRFLKAVDDQQRAWIERLAVTLRFDHEAALATLGVPFADHMWQNLLRFTFVNEGNIDSTWVIHGHMRALLLTAMSVEQRVGAHEFWRGYWQGRADSIESDLAALSWYHWWNIAPIEALDTWNHHIKCAHEQLNMSTHYKLLSWWHPIELSSEIVDDLFLLTALNNISIEMINASLGDRHTNLQQALYYSQMALQVPMCEQIPQMWATVQNTIGGIFLHLFDAERNNNLRRAIECFNNAQSVWTQESSSYVWAALEVNKGIAYSSMPEENRTATLNQAMRCFENAENFLSRDAFPKEWAGIQNSKGHTAANYGTGNQAIIREQVIRHFDQALTIQSRNASPLDWAITHINKGCALAILSDEDPKLLHGAIASFDCALEIFGRKNFPTRWATIQIEKGKALSKLKMGPQYTNLQQALICFENALIVFEQDVDKLFWAIAQSEIGTLLSRMSATDGHIELDQIIQYYHRALHTLKKESWPEVWADTQISKANALLNWERELRPTNLKQAFECLNNALEVFTRQSFPKKWAIVQQKKGVILWRLPIGNRTINLQKSVRHCNAALDIFTQISSRIEWARTLLIKGSALLDLPPGTLPNQSRRALACFDLALKVYSREAFPLEWATAQSQKGNAHLEITNGNTMFNIKKSIECFESALEAQTPESSPDDWAANHNNLGRAFIALEEGDKAANVRRAIDCFDCALTVYSRDSSPQKWAMTQCNKGLALLSSSGGSISARSEAKICFNNALSLLHETDFPYEWACMMFNFGLLDIQEEQPTFAADKIQLAANKFRQIKQEAWAEKAEAVLREISGS